MEGHLAALDNAFAALDTFDPASTEASLRAVADAVCVPVIASGGAGDASHVAAALEVAQAALLASILHEDPERLTSLREELRGMGVALRDAA